MHPIHNFFLSGYYVIAVPVGVGLMFPFGANLGVFGFWSAQLIAETFLSLLLLTFQFCLINWEEEVDKARERIQDDSLLLQEPCNG